MNAKPSRNISTVRKRAIALLGSLASFSACSAAEGPAIYSHSGSETITEMLLGQKGGALTVPETGTVLDRSRVVVPPDALAKEVKIKLIRETGTLRLKSGVSSNAFLRIDAGAVKAFSEPVEIEITFDRKEVGKRMIQGYSIDEEGRLAPVFMKSMDRSKGKAVFSTMVPLLFTWVITSK